MRTDGTVRAFVGVGANMGDAVSAVRGALAALDTLPDTRLAAQSSLYRSAPVDAGGPDFTNAVAELRTGLDPVTLLAALHALEAQQGRGRPYRNAPRTLDLDLLLHGEHRSAEPALTLPHPRLHLRAFVLRPLLEIRPDLIVPGLGRLADHLTRVAGQRIERLEP
jgi:2-amino-4-hydroxy-6-hydroxymethyldihydropteridine diphosphokinase